MSEFERTSLRRRLWSVVVLLPTALMCGYALVWGIASNPAQVARSPIFDTMTKVIPAAVWGWGWFIVAAACVIGGVSGSWQWLRLATVLGWTLATGFLFSVMWARFVNDEVISMVAIGWAYSLWAMCGYSSLIGHLGPTERSHPESEGADQ